MTKGQRANIPALKEFVYDLIGMTTQKTALCIIEPDFL